MPLLLVLDGPSAMCPSALPITLCVVPALFTTLASLPKLTLFLRLSLQVLCSRVTCRVWVGETLFPNGRLRTLSIRLVSGLVGYVCFRCPLVMCWCLSTGLSLTQCTMLHIYRLW